MKKAIIIIPQNGNGVDVTTNGVNLVTIVNAITNLNKGLCQQLVKEAEAVVGDNIEAQEKYLQMLCDRAQKEEGKSEGGLSSRDILKDN